MSMNPASEAQQSRRQDQMRLQEECERLRKLVCALERGGPVPADLEATCLPSSKEVAGRLPPLALMATGAAQVSVCLSISLSYVGSQAAGGAGQKVR